MEPAAPAGQAFGVLCPAAYTLQMRRKAAIRQDAWKTRLIIKQNSSCSMQEEFYYDMLSDPKGRKRHGSRRNTFAVQNRSKLKFKIQRCIFVGTAPDNELGREQRLTILGDGMVNFVNEQLDRFGAHLCNWCCHSGDGRIVNF